MKIVSQLLVLLLVGACAPAHAVKPVPMTPTALPMARPVTMTLLIPDEFYVLQEDQINVYYLPMPGNYALTASQSFAYGAALGAVGALVSETVALTRRTNDRKRLRRIEAKLGTHAWGQRLREALQTSLAATPLGTGFDFNTKVPRKRVGARTFDAPGRAWGLLEGHVAFSPGLRGVRIHVQGVVEDRRVIRDTKLRMQLERQPLRQVSVEYLIALPEDDGLSQKERAQRWAEQDPQAFTAAIETGIAETVRLVNQYWHQPDAPVSSGEPARFRLDKGIRGKGQILEQDAQRVLIADNNGAVHSLPVELTRRGFLD